MTIDNAQVQAKDHPIAAQYTPQQSHDLAAFRSLSRQAQVETFDNLDPSRLIFFIAFDGTKSN